MESAPPPVTVAIVAIAGERLLERCLRALSKQIDAPQFDIVVAASDRIGSLERTRRAFPEARVFVESGIRTPIELAAIAVRESPGSIVLLTEDHCVPDSDWVHALSDSVSSVCGAVGGAVEPLGSLSLFEWAFYFVDFHRYSETLKEGPVASLSVCNIAYRRADLDKLEEDWRKSFHETRINGALAKRIGPLWMEPRARVRTRRRVGRPAALRERYGFGRVFACKRVDGRPVLRFFLAVVSPTLPLLLMIQLARGAIRRRDSTAMFFQSFPQLVGLVAAWSAGEILGYVTGTMPQAAEAALELETTPAEP